MNFVSFVVEGFCLCTTWPLALDSRRLAHRFAKTLQKLSREDAAPARSANSMSANCLQLSDAALNCTDTA